MLRYLKVKIPGVSWVSFSKGCLELGGVGCLEFNFLGFYGFLDWIGYGRTRRRLGGVGGLA